MSRRIYETSLVSDDAAEADVARRTVDHLQRALSAELVKDGMSKDEIEIRGYGETRLVVPTANDVREPWPNHFRMISGTLYEPAASGMRPFFSQFVAVRATTARGTAEGFSRQRARRMLL